MARFVLLSIMFINTVALGQTAFRIQAIELVKEGDLYLSQGDWDKALFTYTNAIQADVTYAEAYMKRGRLLEMTTHTTEASIDYHQAMLLNPYIDIYYNDQTLLKLIQTKYYGAYNDITALIELNPDSEAYPTEQYDMFIQLDLYEAYFEDSLSAQTVSAEHIEVLNLLKDHNYFKASQHIDSLLLGDINDHIALDFQGVLYLLESNLYDAKLAFDQSIKANNNYFPSYYNRAVTHRFLGDNEKAHDDINKAIEIHDHEDAYFKRALIKKENGAIDDALLDYNQAITLDTDFDKAIYNRAFTNKLLGNYEDALKDLEVLIKEDPQNHSLWDMKGSVYMLYGDLDDALICFDQAISYDNSCAKCYYHRGLTYTLLQIPLKGCEDLEKSMNLGLSSAQSIFDSFCGF